MIFKANKLKRYANNLGVCWYDSMQVIFHINLLRWLVIRNLNWAVDRKL